jgi:hypothetical protein
MHNRSALGTFFFPRFDVRCGDGRLARLSGPFHPSHSFFVCLSHGTLWVNAARRVGHFTTDGAMLSIRTGLQRLRLSMHDLLRVSVKGSRAWVNKHGVSLRSENHSRDTTELQIGSVFGFANFQQQYDSSRTLDRRHLLASAPRKEPALGLHSCCEV